MATQIGPVPSIMLSAGEASGDLHGRTLCRALMDLHPGVRLFGMGGGRMAAAGMEVIADPTGQAVVGTSEALWRIPELYRAYRALVARLRDERPRAHRGPRSGRAAPAAGRSRGCAAGGSRGGPHLRGDGGRRRRPDRLGHRDARGCAARRAHGRLLSRLASHRERRPPARARSVLVQPAEHRGRPRHRARDPPGRSHGTTAGLRGPQAPGRSGGGDGTAHRVQGSAGAARRARGRAARRDRGAAGGAAGMKVPAPLERAMAPVLGAMVVRLLAPTLRIRREEAAVDALWRAGAPAIYAVWHGRILLLPYLYGWRRARVLASRSRDGELVTRFVARFGLEAVRGSSSRGGAEALRLLARGLAEGRDAVVVPDGPRGPREIVKPGIVALARLSGAPIVPVALGASAEWQLRSWDDFRIPRPFARCVLRFGDVIRVPSDADRAAQEAARKEIEAVLS